MMQESPPGVPVTKIMMKHQFHHLEVNTMGYGHGFNFRTPCAQHMIAHRQKVPRRPGASPLARVCSRRTYRTLRVGRTSVAPRL